MLRLLQFFVYSECIPSPRVGSEEKMPFLYVVVLSFWDQMPDNSFGSSPWVSSRNKSHCADTCPSWGEEHRTSSGIQQLVRFLLRFEFEVKYFYEQIYAKERVSIGMYFWRKSVNKLTCVVYICCLKCLPHHQKHLVFLHILLAIKYTS